MSLLLALLPSLLVAAAISLMEWRLRPAASDLWLNLQAAAINLLVALTVLPLFTLSQAPSLFDAAAMPLWLASIAFLLVRDFAEFLYHRAQHSIPWLWALHSLHHSDPEMSAMTTHRHHWADQLIKSLTIWPLAALVVAPTNAVLMVYSLCALWHFVAHARLPLNFGRWSWLLNSPAYHRRHHSRLPEHFNSNYAGLFPIFDVIFGSYNRPAGFPPTGLDIQPSSALDLMLWPTRQSKLAQTVAAPEVIPGRSAPMPEKPMEYPPSTGIVTPVT